MAIVTRYFSTSSAGAADGTTWADRAVLVSGSTWSSVLTAFDFSGSGNSLRIYIGPGTYTPTAALTFASAPSAANSFQALACDSSGNEISPPDPDWTADQPVWDDSIYPYINANFNGVLANYNYMLFRCLKIANSGRTGGAVLDGLNVLDWVIMENSASNTSALAFGSNGGGFAYNSVLRVTQTTFSAVSRGTVLNNCRLHGSAASGGSGTRAGYSRAVNDYLAGLIRCCIFNVPGCGIIYDGSNLYGGEPLNRNTIVNVGSDGICLPSTASQARQFKATNNYIANCGGYGINANGAGHIVAVRNRLRDNTSGNLNLFGNDSDVASYTIDSDDATEFANSGSNDYRIKNTATIWGYGYGVSDEPAAASGGSRNVPL